MFQGNSEGNHFFLHTLKFLLVETNDKKNPRILRLQLSKKKDSSVLVFLRFFFSRMWSEVFLWMDRPTMILDFKDHPEWEVPEKFAKKNG